MQGKFVGLDFGHVFIDEAKQRDRVVRSIEKAVQVNVDAILEEGAFRHRVEPNSKPLRLRVTVSLEETV